MRLAAPDSAGALGKQVGATLANEANLGKGRPDVLVLIPSYGDKDALPAILAGVARLGPRYRPLVVDDGSPVPLEREALRGALFVRLPANFGLGACIDIAFRHALAHDYGAVVRLDADGQHSVDDIPRLLVEIDAGRADVVAGTRTNQDQGASSLLRQLLKRYLSAAAMLATGGRAPRDVNTGFFALNRKAVAVIRSSALERFPEPELFVSACAGGLRVGSVDIEQSQRLQGRSTISTVAGARIFFRFTVFAIGQMIRRMFRWFTA